MDDLPPPLLQWEFDSQIGCNGDMSLCVTRIQLQATAVIELVDLPHEVGRPV